MAATVWSSGVPPVSGRRQIYPALKMTEREAIAITHIIVQKRMDEVRKSSGDDDITKIRVKKKRKTWEEVLT